jgi:hypothetical protein
MAAVAEQEKELLSSVVDDTRSYFGFDPLHPWLWYDTTACRSLPSLSCDSIFCDFVPVFCASVTDRPMTPHLPRCFFALLSRGCRNWSGLPLATLREKLPRFLQKCALSLTPSAHGSVASRSLEMAGEEERKRVLLSYAVPIVSSRNTTTSSTTGSGSRTGHGRRRSMWARSARKAGDRRCMPAASPSLYLSVGLQPHDARSESHGLFGVMFLDEYVRVLSLSLFCRRKKIAAPTC